MAFSLVHFYTHLFLYSKAGNFDMRSTYQPPNNGIIEYDYSFSQQSSEESYSVTIHNLTREHAKMFTQGSTVSIWSGWESSDRHQNNISHIFMSHISNVEPLTNNDGDWELQFTCTDGQPIPNGTATSKAKSESKRNDASGKSSRSGIASGRKAANAKISKQSKKIRADISRARKRLKKYVNKHKNEYEAFKAANRKSRIHGKGEKAANAAISASNKRVMAKYKSLMGSLRKYKSSYENSLKKRSSNLTKRTKKARRRVRSKYAAKEQRAKRKKSKKKSKSKKQKQTGLHFKKNIKASKIIKALAKKDHLHIDKMKLVKDKKYTSGYTADKNLRQAIRDVVSDCNSDVWFPNGKIVIGNFSKGIPTGFTLTPTTGLTQTPQPTDDDDGDTNGSSKTTPTWEVNATFLPGITAGSRLKIIDPDRSVNQMVKDDTNGTAEAGDNDPISRGQLFDDNVIVLSGELSVSSGEFSSDLTVERESDAQKNKIANIKSKNSKARKSKAKKDKAKRAKVHKTRKARQSHRIKSHKAKTSKRKR